MPNRQIHLHYSVHFFFVCNNLIRSLIRVLGGQYVQLNITFFAIFQADFLSDNNIHIYCYKPTLYALFLFTFTYYANVLIIIFASNYFS